MVFLSIQLCLWLNLFVLSVMCNYWNDVLLGSEIHAKYMPANSVYTLSTYGGRDYKNLHQKKENMAI